MSRVDCVCLYSLFIFFFNDTATTEIYTLSLHDALPISAPTTVPLNRRSEVRPRCVRISSSVRRSFVCVNVSNPLECDWRSEEHTSELQSRSDIVCRLLLEKKKNLE